MCFPKYPISPQNPAKWDSNAVQEAKQSMGDSSRSCGVGWKLLASAERPSRDATRSNEQHLGNWQIVLAVLLTSLLSNQGSAQTPNNPFGLNIPAGAVQPAAGERVVTRGDDEQTVVAQTHVKVGSSRIVMLPDGKLVTRTAAESTPTERPFVGIDKSTLAKQLTSDRFKGFRTKQTNRYLYVYDTSEPFALATSRILETMFPGVKGYADIQKIKTHNPQVPLVAIMFRSEAAFQNYRRMPPGVVAYYDVISNHVVMYERATSTAIKPELAIQQSIATIAHEGAHQILHNIGVQQRLSVWPMWLSEGLAEFFAPTSTDKRMKWKGAGQVNDMRMFELEQYIKSRSGGQLDGKMIEDTVQAARLTSTGYASAWSLTHYLAKNYRTNFNRYVLSLSKLGPLEGNSRVVPPGIVSENLAQFNEYFSDDLADTEKRLVLHLRKQPYRDPFAEWPHFVAVISYSSGKRIHSDANVFHTESVAAKWLTDSRSRVPEQHRATIRTQIRPAINRAAAERLARQFSQ